MPGDAIVPTWLLPLTSRRTSICVWFDDVMHVREPKALERSQASSVLNNNMVNHPFPYPRPSRTSFFERASRLRQARSDFPSASKHVVWEGSE